MRLLLIYLCFILFFGCKTEKRSQLTNQSLKYAKRLQINKYDNFTIVTINQNLENNNLNDKYILYKKNTILPDSLKKYTQIAVPIERIVVTSTTHIPSLEMLRKEHTLVAFPSTNYISSKKTRALINNNKIKDLGNNQSMNTELILSLKPNVLVSFLVGAKDKNLEWLSKHNIPVLNNADWLEETPLGKAEWIKFFGELYDMPNEANVIFNEIEKQYLQTAALAKTSKKIPIVFSGSEYEGKWYVPQGNSWAATFLKDANCNYIWSNTYGSGSITLMFEEVLDKAKNADFWIGSGQYSAYNELLKSNYNYAHFKSFKNKSIYTFSHNKGETGGIIYYELAPNRPDWVLKDLVKILHPELLPTHKLYFFKPLN